MNLVQVAPDVSITKTPATGSVPLGGVFTYNIRLNNTGTAPANNVTMVDTLPPGLQYDPVWTPPTGMYLHALLNGPTAVVLKACRLSFPHVSSVHAHWCVPYPRRE